MSDHSVLGRKLQESSCTSFRVDFEGYWTCSVIGCEEGECSYTIEYGFRKVKLPGRS